MLRAYRSWKGALSLEISGVPMFVNVEFWARSKRLRNESFKTLAPSGQPVNSIYVDPETEEKVERDECRKGVKSGDGFVALTPEAIESIDSGQKTQLIEADTFCPVSSIALDLAFERFAVRPQDDVAGSADAVGILWNGLRATKLAWLSQMSIRGGADAIVVVYGDDSGLWAALLPFEEELYPTPTYSFTPNKKAQALFQQFIEAEHDVEEFDHSAFVSEYRERRQTAIEAVLKGKKVKVTKAPKAKDAVPDLMAVLEASTKKSAKKAPAKTAARKKVAA